jgi:hypothetical protein
MGRLTGLALAAVAAAASTGCAAVGLGGGWHAEVRIGTGAQGGQTSRVTLAGAVHRLAAKMMEEPFPFTISPGPHDPPRWYLVADEVPASKVLVLESIDVAAAAPGDANGHGEVGIALPGGDAFRIVDEAGPYQVWLEGRAMLLPSEAAEVAVEVANSSNAEISMSGRLVSPEEAATLAPEPFVVGKAPEGTTRVGGKIGLLRKWYLEKPLATLQVRAGAVGGAAVRVTLLGRGTSSVKRTVTSPMNMSRGVSMQEEATAFSGGGRVPAGRTWVITKVSYEGSAAGDSNGPGGSSSPRAARRSSGSAATRARRRAPGRAASRSGPATSRRCSSRSATPAPAARPSRGRSSSAWRSRRPPTPPARLPGSSSPPSPRPAPP